MLLGNTPSNSFFRQSLSLLSDFQSISLYKQSEKLANFREFSADGAESKAKGFF
jgi:hypothetical protein